MSNIRIQPPSKKETERFCKLIAGGYLQTTAATRLGWSGSRMDAIVRYGRQGVPGFKEFMDAYDAELDMGSALLRERIAEKIAEGNLTAVLFEYRRRYGLREEAREKASVEREIADEVETSFEAPSDDDVAAAEARALGLATAEAEVSEKH